ncbi:siderophore-interacting protein [Modicisalibacter radicis]|uniref:siderophore-interacting protein n=1 Tax=Halomonas sp. EAR18 TaxID=2518972 RepID=UPI00109C4CBA|nr:siderophore-interacting protein [Halomonas sp. EAR18]
MSRSAPREFTVTGRRFVTPHMLRITLGGEGMADFPADQESAYIKLVFPRGEEERPLMRTYTVRHQRPDEIDVDFVIHESAGPASRWALAAEPGERILIGGPGPRKLIHDEADWFLLIGDMTALPAISVNLAMLPADAQGHALIEVLDEADIQPLEHPAGLNLHWLVNPTPDPEGDALLERLRGLSMPAGQPAVWGACEFASMRKLRSHLKQTYTLNKQQLYLSSYWKMGNSEDQHKLAKSQDAAEHSTA